MNESRDVERRISTWMEEEEAGTRYPDRLLREALDDTREQRQVRALPSRTLLVQHSFSFLSGAAAAVVLVVVGALAVGLIGGQRGVGVGATPSPSVHSPSPAPSSPAPSPSVASPEITAMFDAFIQARIAGSGAGQYLNDPGSVPLLYATSAGDPYERGEFEPVLGIEWPYGYSAFKVRMTAGGTVVEQLFFWPNGEVAGLVYEPNGFGTDIPPTTEAGQPLAQEFQFFNGALTVKAAHPWLMSTVGLIPFGRLIPEGPGVPPTTDGGERNDWDQIFFMADPKWVGPDCKTVDPGDAEAHAAALAESIRSAPGLEATAPVPVKAGGFDGLLLDVKVPAGADLCWNVQEDGSDPTDDPGVLYPLWDRNSEEFAGDGHATGHATGEWMRLYLFDVPATSGMQWLVISVVAPEATFQRAVDAAQPVVDSIQINSF
jgi:hypothetical protein